MMAIDRTRLLVLLAALALALAAAWFRIVGTLAEPLWLDEAYSAYAAAKGWHFLWHVVPAYETHPPFYYSLLRLWTLVFGDALPALRALGMTMGLLALVPVALSARALARIGEAPRWPTMLAALLLVALSPALVEMAREVRPYPLLILTYAGATALLLHLGRIAAATRRIAHRPFALYLACVALILWLHNLGPLYAAALGLALLVLVARPGLGAKGWTILIGGHALPILLWLPALAILLDQAPMWIKATWLHFTPATLPNKLALIWAAPDRFAILAGLLLVMLGIAALARTREGARAAGALLLLGGVPVAGSIAISAWIAPVFIPRTLTACATPALLLMAAGATLPRMPWRAVGLVALGVIAWQMLGIDIRARHAGPQQDWYPAVAWLQQRYRPGDEVWAYPNEGALPFDYAVRDKRLAMVTRPIPGAIPALHPPPGSWYVSGSRGVPSLDRAHLRALAEAPAGRRPPTIWLLRLGANAYDKGDVMVDELRRSGRVMVASCESYPIDFIGLRRGGPAAVLPAKRARCRP